MIPPPQVPPIFSHQGGPLDGADALTCFTLRVGVVSEEGGSGFSMDCWLHPALSIPNQHEMRLLIARELLTFSEALIRHVETEVDGKPTLPLHETIPVGTRSKAERIETLVNETEAAGFDYIPTSILRKFLS